MRSAEGIVEQNYTFLLIFGTLPLQADLVSQHQSRMNKIRNIGDSLQESSFTILHGLRYIHYPVDIIHQITIFRTQVISGPSEWTHNLFPQSQLFDRNMPPTQSHEHLCTFLAFFCKLLIPVLVPAFSELVVKVACQLGPTSSPGRTMLPHLLGGPAVEKVHAPHMIGFHFVKLRPLGGEFFLQQNTCLTVV